MELHTQLRITPVDSGVRARLEASSPDGGVSVLVEVTGANEGEALAALAERTRALYGAVPSLVEMAEELSRTYDSASEDRPPA